MSVVVQKTPESRAVTDAGGPKRRPLYLLFILLAFALAAIVLALVNASENSLLVAETDSGQPHSLRPLEGAVISGPVALYTADDEGSSGSITFALAGPDTGKSQTRLAMNDSGLWDTSTLQDGAYTIAAMRQSEGDRKSLGSATFIVENGREEPSASRDQEPAANAGQEPVPDALDLLIDVDFEEVPIGPVNEDVFRRAFGDPSLATLKAKPTAGDIVNNMGSQVLQLKYDEGESFPGHSAEIVIPPSTYAELEYRFMFDESFTPNFDADTVGGKLPGLGAAGESSAYVEGVIKPPMHCVDGVGDKDGWSARHMWHHGAGMHQYLYYPGRANNCGDTNFFFGDERGTGWLEAGRWYSLRQEIDIEQNTIVTYVDGQLAATSNDIPFNDQSINRLIWHTYINKPGPVNATSIYFDDIRVRGR